MTAQVTVATELRGQLDEIDRVAVEGALKGFYESRLKIAVAVWEKGKVVCGFRGVNPNATSRELAAATGRHYEELKRWCDLYKRYPKLENFVEKYAKPKAEAWTRKALATPARLSAAETPALPEGAYTVIYADPPWEYEFSQSNSRGVEQHYPTMSLESLKSLPVPAAEDAVLFLWATAPKLSEALEVMEAWGFTYRTDAVWDKEKIGMGYWFRGQHELLLVATKGNVPAPATDARVASVIRSPREEHSRKPGIVYEIIERMLPNQKYIELFARGKARPGWVGWGRDAE